MWRNIRRGPENPGASQPSRGMDPGMSKIGILTLVAILTIADIPGSTQETPASPEAQTLHVLVGKSVVVNLEAPLKRVLVGNPVVAKAMTTSPTQVVMTAKAAGTTSLILWDETGRSRILDVIVDVDVSGLRDAIQEAYPNEPIEVHAVSERVFFSGAVSDPRIIDDVMKMAASFSKEIVNSLTLGAAPHERQILLEVKFAEIDRSRLEQLGLNLFSTGALNTPGSISTQQFSPPAASGTLRGAIGAPLLGTTSTFTVSDLLNIFLFRPDLNLAATIKDLQAKSVLQILAEPNLLALNGKPARFLAGGEFPFPVVQGGTNFTAVTIQFRPFGVRLEFTGFISKDGVIRLQVSPEVSTLDFTNALTISGFLVPAISTRRAETEIELRDGQGFGIAGLLDQRTQAQLNKIPGIGDIPVLGQLFRSKSITRSRTELLVLVTPRIMDPVKMALTPPALPKPAMPSLNVPKFDRNLPKGEASGNSPGHSPSQ